MIDNKLVDAQQARRVLDRLVGYKISPILCKKIQNKLSAGHARTLVVVSDVEAQIKLAQKACNMSVRDTEKMVREYLNPKPVKEKPQQSIELKELVGNMQRVFATKVGAIGNDNKGRLYIDYYTKDDLDRICEMIEELKNKQ